MYKHSDTHGMHTHGTHAHTAVHDFLSIDLTRETLSTNNELKRQKLLEEMVHLIDKICSSHPSIRPRMNTPAGLKPPAPPPPKEENEPIPEEEPEQELYTDMDNQNLEMDATAEDYLTFSPQPPNEDESQDVYEDVKADEPQDVYEEPGMFVCVCLYLSLLHLCM